MISESEKDRLAYELKFEIGRQFGAKPMASPNPNEDWTAQGGELNLSKCIDVLLIEFEAMGYILTKCKDAA